jgi:hypothetical protein
MVMASFGCGSGWWFGSSIAEVNLDAGRRTESHCWARPDGGNRVDNGRRTTSLAEVTREV